MPIVGQMASWMANHHINGFGIFSDTIQVLNRDTFAEIALIDHSDFDPGFAQSKCGITQIVSDSGVENFDINLITQRRSIAFRTNVTSITFSVLSANTRTGARWMLHFWS
jgi:hypothetical protein